MRDGPIELPEPLAGLMREHRAAEEVVQETRAAVEAGLGAPEGSDAEVEALSRLYLRRDFLGYELTVHIAKEERVLFPALRRMLASSDALIDDMLAEHEMVRERQRRLRHTLDELEDDHEAVDGARLGLNASLEVAAQNGLSDVLTALRETVTQLDWILQGHFTGEEDGLFLPAAGLLPPAAFTLLEEQRREIETAPRQP
jgi:hemerythrin-like domain-containing protein